MLNKGTVANATAMLCCRVLADGLGVVLFLLISRQLGPQGIGVYAYGFAIATLLYAIVTLGVEQYGVREYRRRTRPESNRLIRELLGLQLVVAAVALAALAAYLAITHPTPSALLVICALCVHQLFLAIAATLFVPAMANEDMSRPALMGLLTRGTAAAIACAVLWMSKDSLSVSMLAFPATAVLYLGSALRSARTHIDSLRPDFDADSSMRAVRAMWPFATVEALRLLLLRAGVIVLALTLGERDAGIYATGLKVIEILFLPLWFAGVALYPRLCSSYADDRRRFAKNASTLFWCALGISAAIAMLLYSGIPRLLVPVLGAGYTGAEREIGAMGAIALVYGAEMALGRILFASDLDKYRAFTIAVGAIGGLVLNVVLVRYMGVGGAIAATASAYLVIVAGYAIGLRSRGRKAVAPSSARTLLDTSEPGGG